MDTIKFANGSVHNCSFLSTIPNGETNTAYVALADVDFVEAARIFSDPNMTRLMEYGVYRLNDYTNLVDLNKQPYGIQATLKGGYDEIYHTS